MTVEVVTPGEATNAEAATVPGGHDAMETEAGQAQDEAVAAPPPPPPTLRPAAALPDDRDSSADVRWGVYTTVDQVDRLLGWLHRKGTREGPLRSALAKVRDVMASATPLTLSLSPTPAAPGATPPALPQILLCSEANARPLAAEAEPSLHTAGAEGTQQAGDSAEADAVRAELLRLFSGLPEGSLRSTGASFWGSAQRQVRFRRAVVHVLVHVIEQLRTLCALTSGRVLSALLLHCLWQPACNNPALLQCTS